MVSNHYIDSVTQSGNLVGPLAGATAVEMLKGWEVSLKAMTPETLEEVIARRRETCLATRELAAQPVGLHSQSTRKAVGITHLLDIATAMYEMACNEFAKGQRAAKA